MAIKTIKLGKLLKKMQSFGSLSKKNNSTVHVAASNMDETVTGYNPSGKLLPVYVGKTRRRYMVNSDVVGHPLFRELIVNQNGNSEEIRVGCEVVLFEHLLWMLDNVVDHQVESLDELVDFYAS